MAHTAALPIIASKSGFLRYLDEIRPFPILEPRKEYMLAKRWPNGGLLKRLGVIAKGVMNMNRPLAGDASINTFDDCVSEDWQEWIVDEQEHDGQQTVVVASEEMCHRRAELSKAIKVLNTRERCIFVARRLVDEPVKFDRLAEQFAISQEQVREIEMRAFEKVHNAVSRPRADTERPSAVLMF